MKIFAIVALSLVGAVVLGMALYLLLGAILFKMALSRKSVVKRVINKTVAKTMQIYKMDFDWWNKYNFQNISIKSFDGLKLVAHYLSTGSNYLAIVVHGYGADYREMQQYCKYFVDRGYDLLAVENRAHGGSEGKVITMGWLDRLDVVKWAEEMTRRNPSYKIVLMGLSMGASTVCMASGEKLPESVKGVISDCGYANAFDEFKYVFKKRAHVPVFPFLNILHSYTKTMYNFDIKQADATGQLKKSNLPFLFFHGEDDSFVPAQNLQILSSQVPEKNKQVLLVKGADHALSYPTQPIEYERELNKFLRKIM